jgi:ubiquinone/menaquinone biosynthesis C-methylase UbiE
MKFTEERFTPESFGEIRLEHFHRYYFVINQINMIDKVVLDLASGEGYGSDLLANYAKHVFGIDIDGETITHAKSKYIRNNLTFLIGEASHIPLPDHSIDIFVSFETIEHHDKHIEMLNEVKRVLKPDGILVMSSPDRYYYSDKPAFKNEFHVKELYYQEFKCLINSFFKRAFFYSQRIFVGSIIAFDGNMDRYIKPLVMEKDGPSYELTPIYNIVIGTDQNDFETTHQIFLYKEFDYIITKFDMEREIHSIKNSITYKLGDFLIKPLRILKKMIFDKTNM